MDIFAKCHMFMKMASEINYILEEFLDSYFDIDDVAAWQDLNTNMLDWLEAQPISWFRSSDWIYGNSDDDLRKYIISRVRQGDDKYTQIGFLKGYKNIPNFYICYSSKHRINPEYFIDQKDIAHYSFIINAFNIMGIGGYGQKAVDAARDFIIQNKNKLNKIIRLFESPPVLLGTGADGVTFSVGKDKVFKIFKSKTAYISAMDAIKALHSGDDLAKYEAMIYDSGQFEGVKLYYYVIEKMETIKGPNKESFSNLLQSIYNIVIDSFSEEVKNIKQIIDPKDKKNAIYDLEKHIFAEVDKEYLEEVENLITENNLKIKNGWIHELILEIIVKLVTNRTDLHVGNIGITNYGDFRFFDPSYG